MKKKYFWSLSSDGSKMEQFNTNNIPVVPGFEKYKIISASVTRSGSTVLSNLLYGFFTPHLPQNMGGGGQDINKHILTSHIMDVDYWLRHPINEDGDRLQDKYETFFIGSERRDIRGKLAPAEYKQYKNTIMFDFCELNVKGDYTLENMVDWVYKKLQNNLPEDLWRMMCKKSAIKRIEDMNNFYETIKHKPIEFSDDFYLIHGRHKGRGVKGDEVTKLENQVASFFGAKYGVAVDCCTHAVELCLRYNKCPKVLSPHRTYLSIPFLAQKIGIPLEWRNESWQDYYVVGENPVNNKKIYDAAVLWRRDSYIPESFMCLSFQFQKHLNLGRGGMILTDDATAADELRIMAHDGRRPNVPWRNQNIEYMGYHYYMTPETAKLGLDKLPTAMRTDPKIWTMEEWPDLTKMDIFNKGMV